MRKTMISLSLLGGLFGPALASAQVQAAAGVQLQLGLPVVLPPLVVVSPGVQVVPDVDEEVFFTDGYYWVHRDSVWYRSHNHRGGWVVVPGRRVPPRLVGLPPGRYRHWHPAGRPGPAPAPVMYRGGPGPAPHYRGGGHDRGPEYREHGGPDRHGGGGHDRRDDGRGRGHGRGHDHD